MIRSAPLCDRPIEAVFSAAAEPLAADPTGALYAIDHRALIVSDLHLEKGSSFARSGQLLPPYDSAATIARLARAVERYRPRMVIALGDSFHDAGGPFRLDAADRAALLALQRSRDWIWVAGNHDPAPPAGCGGEAAAEIALGSLALRHEPRPGAGLAEIAGHLHPVARIAARGQSLRRRCFATDGARVVLPAFGAYAGGLNVTDAAFAGLFRPGALTAWMLGASGVYAAPEGGLRPD